MGRDREDGQYRNSKKLEAIIGRKRPMNLNERMPAFFTIFFEAGLRFCIFFQKMAKKKPKKGQQNTKKTRKKVYFLRQAFLFAGTQPGCSEKKLLKSGTPSAFNCTWCLRFAFTSARLPRFFIFWWPSGHQNLKNRGKRAAPPHGACNWRTARNRQCRQQLEKASQSTHQAKTAEPC